jgi:hypothetical protein
MDDPTPTEATGTDIYGALVGWTHSPLDERIVLNVQSIEHGNLAPDNVSTAHFLMTKNQALLLGTVPVSPATASAS